jgi:C1A family cysteine protease
MMVTITDKMRPKSSIVQAPTTCLLARTSKCPENPVVVESRRRNHLQLGSDFDRGAVELDRSSAVRNHVKTSRCWYAYL